MLRPLLGYGAVYILMAFRCDVAETVQFDLLLHMSFCSSAGGWMQL